MTNTQTKRPIYEIGFCAKKGSDGKGGDILGSMVRLAAVWERKDATKGGIIDPYTKSDVNRIGDGVFFLLPPTLPEKPDASKTYPMNEIGYCAKKGVDQYGKDILGPMVRLATVWARKDASKGGRIEYHVPSASPEADMGPGVIFLVPLQDKQTSGSDIQDHDPQTGEVYDNTDHQAPSPEEQF
jgi:hypothetical protein